MVEQKPYLIEIITTLKEHGVAFIVCGGVAAVFHGVERMTMDLDISLDMTEENVKRFLGAMHDLRLVPRAPVKAESLLDAEALKNMVVQKNALVFTFWDPESPYRQIDVFLTEDHAFQALADHSVEARVDGLPVKVLSCEKLLALKKAIPRPRDKDRLDMEALKRILEEKA